MPNNQFLPWATGVGANTYTPAVYAGNSAISQGVQNGQADPALFNTTLRQSSSVIAMVAQFIADHQSGDVLDNGNIAALETQFQVAMQSVAGTTRLSSGQDTGAADTLVVATTPTFTALNPGQIIFVTRGAAANTTGTPTVAFNGLTPVRIYKPSGAAVLAGDLPANTELMLGVDPSGVVRLLSTGLSISDITAIAASVVSSNILGDGQCRLSVLNTTTLKLSPFAGSSLIINGVYQALPTSGITLQLTGPSPTTQYFIYAYMNGSTMTLEGSTTGYTLDAFGRANKTGDTTRRLVGWSYTNSASQFQNDPTWRGLSNYFNRQSLLIDGGAMTNVNVPSNTTVSLDAAIPFWSWSGDETKIYLIVAGTTNGTFGPILYVDGSPVGFYGQGWQAANNYNGTNTGALQGNASNYNSILFEGIHNTQASLYNSYGSTNNYSYIRHYGYIRG